MGKRFASACQPTKLPTTTMFSPPKLNLRSLTMGFDEVDPRQLASSVGKTGAGIMVSTAPSKGDTDRICKRQLADHINKPKLADPGNTRRFADPLEKRQSARFTCKKRICSSNEFQSALAGASGGVFRPRIRFEFNCWSIQFFRKQSWHAGLDRSATTGAGRTRGSVDCARPVVDS